MPRDLILGYSTWFSLLSMVVKTVMPLSGCNQVIILHAFIGLRKTRYHFYDVGLRLEVISHVGKFVALVHVDGIMPPESQAHLLVESIYVTQDLK